MGHFNYEIKLRKKSDCNIRAVYLGTATFYGTVFNLVLTEEVGNHVEVFTVRCKQIGNRTNADSIKAAEEALGIGD